MQTDTAKSYAEKRRPKVGRTTKLDANNAPLWRTYWLPGALIKVHYVWR